MPDTKPGQCVVDLKTNKIHNATGACKIEHDKIKNFAGLDGAIAEGFIKCGVCFPGPFRIIPEFREIARPLRRMNMKGSVIVQKQTPDKFIKTK